MRCIKQIVRTSNVTRREASTARLVPVSRDLADRGRRLISRQHSKGAALYKLWIYVIWPALDVGLILAILLYHVTASTFKSLQVALVSKISLQMVGILLLL